MNRNILITGATSGIGFKAILKLLEKGDRIIAPSRNLKRSQDTYLCVKKANIPNLDIDNQLYLPILDLSILKDLKEFVDKELEKGTVIDTLILNAGLQYTGSKEPLWSSDGFELTFAVNHLSHQYLGNRLIPLLCKAKSPRIIITSSEVHNPETPGGSVGKKASLGDLKGLKSGKGFKMIDGDKTFNADKAYKDSKLCNILFARELHKRLLGKGIGIPIIAWAPGLIIPKSRNGFFRYSRKNNELGQRLFALFARDIFQITESPENAGTILSNLAEEEIYNNNSFIYFSNKIKYPGKKIFSQSEISSEASNDKLAEELWDKTNDLFIS